MVPLAVHEFPLCVAMIGLLVLAVQVLDDPRQLLRPSIAVAIMQLAFVVPGAVLATEMPGGMSIDEDLRVAVCAVPLVLALVALLTRESSARSAALVRHCRGALAGPGERNLAVLLSLAAMVLTVAVLTLLPWSEVGLFALLSNPEDSLAARAASLRALEVPELKTLIGVFNRIAVPICLGMLACLPLTAVRRLLLVPLAGGPMLLLALGGARLQLVLGVVILSIGFVIRRWSAWSVLRFTVIAAIAGLTMTAATAARIGFDRTIADVYERVVYRATIQPFMAGVMHHVYVEQMGGWGSEAFGFPLKNSLGVEHIEPSEVVGAWFAPGTGTLVTPPAVMDLMASFGVPLGMLGFAAYALLLDGIAGMLLRVPAAAAVGGLTALLVRSLDLVSTTIGSSLTAAVALMVFALLFRSSPRARTHPGAFAIRVPS